MEVRVATHVHTDKSRRSLGIDSLISLSVAAENKFFGGEIDAFVKSDHHVTEGNQLWKDSGQNYGVTVISGIEIDCKEGHLEGIGIDDRIINKIYRNIPAKEACELIRKCHGLPVVTHPFDPSRYGMGPYILKGLKLDAAIETHNSNVIFDKPNYYAEKLADLLGAIKLKGSDAHSPDAVGLDITIVDADNKSEKSIVEALKDKERILRFENVGYSPLKNLKDLILEKVTASREEIKQNIKKGWDVERMGRKYMHAANCPLIKPIEYALLEVGVRKKESNVWNIPTYAFYGAMYAKELYYRKIKYRKEFKMLDDV